MRSRRRGRLRRSGPVVWQAGSPGAGQGDSSFLLPDQVNPDIVTVRLPIDLGPGRFRGEYGAAMQDAGGQAGAVAQREAVRTGDRLQCAAQVRLLAVKQ